MTLSISKNGVTIGTINLTEGSFETADKDLAQLLGEFKAYGIAEGVAGETEDGGLTDSVKFTPMNDSALALVEEELDIAGYQTVRT